MKQHIASIYSTDLWNTVRMWKGLESNEISRFFCSKEQQTI